MTEPSFESIPHASELRTKLARVPGVQESSSQFSGLGDVAWWVNGKEIAHLDRDGVFDLRLTRQVTRELRAELRADSRVTMRNTSSDWIQLRIGAASDLPFVLELCERAAAAHRPTDGRPPKSPPTGAALERRRRFH